MDGALSVRPVANGATHGYSQIFRDGIVESVQALTLAGEQTRATLRVSTFEPHMAVFLRNVRTELALHNITGDVTVMFSILHADKARLLVPRAQWYDDVQTGDFDRKTLVIPDFLATADTSAELALKPVFDFIWQCAGHPRSLNYDANGQWVPIRDNL
ncbi:hypothetical protein os4_23270 [Comamonadaceae bacterium OS-4]|nr:hypothetical protein os4_23270 [Comamonadaceae bacterium OS-4]